ncbi:hypothetical protein LJR257_005733 [Ensifer adhaerens]|uniref:hypothetical protein n=1 Tax=Ensifer sp. NM-2 TaxID=2109730 RepID=UPI001FE22E09|nr:hypothetical protein [Ensifer sp. NM-2]
MRASERVPRDRRQLIAQAKALGARKPAIGILEYVWRNAEAFAELNRRDIVLRQIRRDGQERPDPDRRCSIQHSQR